MDYAKHLLSLHYKTGKIKLPGLNLVTSLNPKQFFKYGGAHRDIEKDIFEETQDVFPERAIILEHIPGRFGEHVAIEFPDSDIKASYFSISFKSLNFEKFTLSHESTHAAIFLGLEGELLNFLKEKGFSINPFKKYSNEEDIANTFALASVYNLPRYKVDFSSPNTNLFKLYQNLEKSKK